MTNKTVEGVRGKERTKKVKEIKEGSKWVRSKEKEMDLDSIRRYIVQPKKGQYNADFTYYCT